MVETNQFLDRDENASGNERSVDRSVPEVVEIDPVSATDILDWFLRWKEKVGNDDANASKVDMRDNVKTSDCMESKISNCAQDYFSSRSTVVPHELDTIRIQKEIEEKVKTSRENKRQLTEIEKVPETCVICFETVDEMNITSKFRCEHKKYMHSRCIQNVQRCPLCRTKVMISPKSPNRDQSTVIICIMLFALFVFLVFIILHALMHFSFLGGKHSIHDQTNGTETYHLRNRTEYEIYYS